MSAAIAILLALAAAAASLGALALLRLPPLGRIHAVSFVTLIGGGAILVAACLADGATPRSAKIVLIWLVTLLSGSLSAHVCGRAIHLRDGTRR